MEMERKNIEKRLSELLTSDEPGREEAEKEALQKLAPRYEIRVQAEHNPVAEETKQYRKLAKEIDDRYDRYDEVSKEANDENAK